MELQLRLFPETVEESVLRQCKEMKGSLDKCRKSQFAKIGEQTKIVNSIKDDMEIIKKGLCETVSFEKSVYEQFGDRLGQLYDEIEQLKSEVEYLRSDVKNNCDYLHFAIQ